MMWDIDVNLRCVDGVFSLVMKNKKKNIFCGQAFDPIYTPHLYVETTHLTRIMAKLTPDGIVKYVNAMINKYVTERK